MKLVSLLLVLLSLCSCHSRNSADADPVLTSMQVIDRNGFTETISNKDRLRPFQSADFLAPQPYQKVLRVYARTPQGQSQSKITSYHPNGQVWQYLEVADGRAHGAYREWFANGQLHVETQVLEGTADINDLAESSWIFDGKSRVWDEEGGLLAEFSYDKGLLNSSACYYYPRSGKLHRTIPYQQGVPHGSALTYDEEGTVLETTLYLQGKKHGLCTAFWEKGGPRFTEEYTQDRLLTALYYTPAGTPIAEIREGQGKQAQFQEGSLSSLISYEQGEPHGKVELFRPDGTLASSYMIQEGKKNGEEWEYYPSRELIPKLCVHWHEDMIQGQVKTWYENGMKESQREIHANKKQGMSVSWYKTGELMLVEEYENDRLVKGSYYKKGEKKLISRVEEGNGTATLFTRDGIFLKKVPYEKGKPLLAENAS